jgi:hypothetical protein
MYWDTEIKWGNSDSSGKMNRLIVVGINSFDGKNGNKDTPHVVFQFQNIPVTRRMNPEASNAGGYPASEMRKYLTPVTGVDGSGNFLAGLKNAGVPEAVLWDPARVMATKKTEDPKTETINDLLWLPTEYEMFGKKSDADISEDENNQVQLAYYALNNNKNFTKVAKTDKVYPAAVEEQSEYWLASAAKNETRFCIVQSSGSIASATQSKGVAPAFCVYGGPDAPAADE